jgi:hypothetical protein
MIARGIALSTLAVSLVAGSSFAQTAAELLERGIYRQDTVGDLDGAIRIYRQIVHPGVARDVAAHAQLRLAESLLKKGDVASAEQEFARLTREYSDFQALVGRFAARPAARPVLAQQTNDGCCGLFSGYYDELRPVTVSGKVSRMMWVNPQSAITVEGFDGNKWSFSLPAPNMLIRLGLSKDSVKLGEEVLVTGYLAKAGGGQCPSQMPNQGCETFPDGSLHASAQTIMLTDGRVLFDRRTADANQR